MRLDTPHVIVLFLALVSTACAIPNIARSLLIQSYYALHPDLSLPTVPPDFDFWKSANDLGHRASDYAERTMKEEFFEYSAPLEKAKEIKVSVNDLIISMRTLDTLPRVPFNVTELNRRLAKEIEIILEHLLEELKEIPPEDQTERSKKREEITIKALTMVEDALVKVYGHWEVPEREVRERFGDVKPKVLHLVLVIENLVDKHPQVLEIVLFSAAILIAPESRVIRLLLRVFGIGPGEGKESLISWMQKFLFGSYIEQGRWYRRISEAKIIRDPKELGFWGKVLVILEQMVLDFIKGFLNAFLNGRRRKF